MDADQFRLAATLTVVALTFVWVPKVWFWTKLRRQARAAVTFRLVPTGERPELLDTAATSMAATLNNIGSRMPHHCGFTLHRYLDGETIRSAVTVYGVSDPDDVARSLSVAVGAEPQRCDETFELPSPGTVWYSRRSDFENRQTMDNDLPPLGSAAEWLHSTLASVEQDDGVCLSVGVEPMSRMDARMLRRWYNLRSGFRNDTEGIGPGRAARGQVTCWSHDAGLAQQVVTGLPPHLHRWPFTVSSRMVNSLRGWGSTFVSVAAPFGLVAAIALTLNALESIGSSFLSNEDSPVDDPMVPMTPGEWFTTNYALGFLVVAALLGVGALLAWKTRWTLFNRMQGTYESLHRRGIVPVERTPSWSPTRLARQLIGLAMPYDHRTDRDEHKRSTNFPYQVRTLVFNSQHVAEVAAFAPLSDTGGDVTEVASVPAPPRITELVGPLGLDQASTLGLDPNGKPVRLLDSDRRHGVFITGDPGSGKSVTTLQLFRDDAAARRAEPRRRDGRMSMFWLEAKGEGADQATRLLHDAGYGTQDYVRFDITAPDGWRLELLDRTRPELTAARLVSAFTFAFETGAVGPRAAEAMRYAFTLALMVTPDIAEAAGMREQWPNVLAVATMLMGDARPDGTRHKLLQALQKQAALDCHKLLGYVPKDLLDEDAATAMFDEQSAVESERAVTSPDGTASSGVPLYDAFRGWSYYEQMQPRIRREVLESPRNKLTSIGQSTQLWTPDPTRQDVTLRQLLEHHGVAVFNFGSSRHGALDEMTSVRLTSMAMYMLWEEIKATCPGWLDQGRTVGIYADELSNLSGTGSGDDVIEQMRDKGRSFGVQLTLATQRFTQLPLRTQQSALGFGTRMYMTLENIDNAEAAAHDINGGDDGRLSARDIRELPTGRGAIRMRLQDAGMPPFTVQVANPFDTPPGGGVEPTGAVSSVRSAAEEMS